MTAVGVASPSAHGQDITSTDTAAVNAWSASAPRMSHIAAVTADIIITTGTNIPAALSASFATGALDEVASSTSRIICERAVSAPTFSARMTKYPLLLTVAPMTLSPVFFSAGMLSPVSADSSTEALPSVIIPSAGMTEPALTMSISPAQTSAAGISSSLPSRSTTALFGERSISALIASVVFLLARASKYFPRVMRVSIIPTDSKYRSWQKPCARAVSPIE